MLKNEALPEAPNIVSWYAAIFSSLGHLVPHAMPEAEGERLGKACAPLNCWM